MAGDGSGLGTGRTGGRDATTGTIPGRFALAVGIPDLPSPPGWKWTPLSEVAQLESGHTPSRKHPEYWDGDVPWIGIKDAVENHGRSILDTHQHVTELGLAHSSARLLPANTVCLSRTASVGYVVVMDCPMATSQDFVNWVCGPRLDPQFLKYVLVAEREALWRFASGTTHQTIYYPEAKAFAVCLPPLREQRAIAHILGTLDDKIELNRRMNETLEAMARAMFKSWFVDFDPVRTKMESRRPVGLDAATTNTATTTTTTITTSNGNSRSHSHGTSNDNLFPDSFQNSPLGKIPKGWRVTHIGEHVELRRGKTYKSDLKGLPGPHLLGLASIKRNGGFRSDSLTTYGGDSPEKLLLRPGDIYVSLKDVTQSADLLGAVARVPPEIRLGRLTQDTVKLILGSTSPSPVFLHRMLRTPEYREYCRCRATGTTNLGLSREDFLAYEFILPSGQALAFYDGIAESLESRISANRIEASKLAALRETLLPKLLSGEIRVSKAGQTFGRRV